MEWLETLKGTIKKTAGIAYDKSTQLVEITKMNFQISEAETSIDKKFKELGIKLYEEIKAGREIDDETKFIYESIESKYAELEEMKNKVNIIKNVKACLKCGENNSQDNIFCSKCGSKLED